MAAAWQHGYDLFLARSGIRAPSTHSLPPIPSRPQFRCDEKGFLAICAFGLPGRTHEDGPARGIQAALAIVETVKVGRAGWSGLCSLGLVPFFVVMEAVDDEVATNWRGGLQASCHSVM